LRNKKKLYWILQIGGWGAYAAFSLAVGLLSAPSDAAALNAWISTVIFETLLLLLLTQFYRWVIIKEGWLTKPVSLVLPRMLLMLLICSLPIYPIKMGFTWLVGIYSSNLWEMLVVNIITYISFPFLWTVFYFVYHYLERYNQSLKYEAAMREVELAQLKSQLNPHFIFNALNSIRALVDEDPKKSKMAINQLSNILRKSLRYDNTGLTKFEDEYRTVKDYLDLESTRFEERLQTDFDIHPESFDYLVPPLMLQTLVENGIKHGISNLKKGGTIRLKTFVEDNMMHIQIRNTGQIVNGSVPKSGTGIKNTKQRLKLIYGNYADFKIFNENSHTVLTIVKIPKIESYESTNNR
jgi:hypothetical protein